MWCTGYKKVLAVANVVENEILKVYVLRNSAFKGQEKSYHCVDATAIMFAAQSNHFTSLISSIE